jgi:hypothetical protein
MLISIFYIFEITNALQLVSWKVQRIFMPEWKWYGVFDLFMWILNEWTVELKPVIIHDECFGREWWAQVCKLHNSCWTINVKFVTDEEWFYLNFVFEKAKTENSGKVSYQLCLPQSSLYIFYINILLFCNFLSWEFYLKVLIYFFVNINNY